MANKPVLKIVKPGKDVNSTDLRDYRFHSDYTMFKLHDIVGGNVVISAGSQSSYVDISHDLDYIPAFLVYIKIGDYWQLFPMGCRAYITTTGIRVTYDMGEIYGKEFFNVTDYWSTYTSSNVEILLGDFYGNSASGAVRCGSVNIASGDTIVSAKLQLMVDGKDGSGNIRWSTYGIDEDNTDSFNNPMERNKTDAFSSNVRSVPTNFGDFVEIDVASQMNEIKARGGWASGNAMGFIMQQSGSDSGCYFASSSGSYLELIKSGSITFPVKVVLFKDKIA